MKPKTMSLILRVCLVCVVLDLPLFFFNMILGAAIMIIAVAVLLFSMWKTWRLMRTDPDAFKALPENEKELSLKDLPPRLIIVLAATMIIATLVQFSVFSFNPLIDTILATLTLVLLVYYFFQKHKLRKKA